MANSLREKLSKLRHDGHITDIEYQKFIKKLDGHDKELRNKAIDDFANFIHKKAFLSSHSDLLRSVTNSINQYIKIVKYFYK